MSADPLLGPEIADDIRPVTRMAIQAQIIPTLRDALTDDHPYVRAVAALALGRVTDHEDAESLHLIMDQMGDQYSFVRQSACLALGLAGGRREAATLLAISRNMPTTRTPLDSNGRRVRPLTRAMASIGVGLIGRRLGSARIAGLLEYLAIPAMNSKGNREVAVGVALAFRLLHDHGLTRDLVGAIAGPGRDTYAGAHLAAALGHRGDAAAMRPLLIATSNSSIHLQRSATIGLGFMKPGAGRIQLETLQLVAERAKDRATRNFAMISLGRVGGAGSTSSLMRHLDHGRSQDRAFAALALGLGSHGSKKLNVRASQAVFDRYQAVRNHHEKSAHAIALGLLGASFAAPTLRRDLVGQLDPRLRSHLCTALALLDDSQSRGIIRNLYQDAPDPELRRQAARAMGLLRDPLATDLLTKAISNAASSPRQISAAVAGLGLLQDGDAVSSLVRMTRTYERVEIRSAAIIGLGHLANKNSIPLFTILHSGTNYLAMTESLFRVLSVP